VKNIAIYRKTLGTLVLVFSCLFAPVFAQTEDKVSSSAKQELQNLLSEFTSFQAIFSQVITDAEGDELQRSSGSISLLTPNKIRWETNEPDESLLIADGETVWNVDHFVEQVTVMDQKAITDSNPLMLLVSDDNSQWNKVSVSKNKRTFTIISTDPEASISQLDLVFDSGQLTSLSSYDRQRQTSLLVFTDVQQNQEVIENTFRFSVPDAYIIDDQRTK
jgi:outer membrane lipoprotein carrier protein